MSCNRVRLNEKLKAISATLVTQASLCASGNHSADRRSLQPCSCSVKRCPLGTNGQRLLQLSLPPTPVFFWCRQVQATHQFIIIRNLQFCFTSNTRGAQTLTHPQGETGSGKSTQVPHFILDALLRGAAHSTPLVLCAQPRRVSALGLATRVSAEMGSALGNSDCFVGYTVRGDSRLGPASLLQYMTGGVLLRRMQGDPKLTGVSAVIIDEVHERDATTDILLSKLRALLLANDSIRIVLMSATADAELFRRQHLPFKHNPKPLQKILTFSQLLWQHRVRCNRRPHVPCACASLGRRACSHAGSV